MKSMQIYFLHTSNLLLSDSVSDKLGILEMNGW